MAVDAFVHICKTIPTIPKFVR